jgi:hypothetical protein
MSRVAASPTGASQPIPEQEKIGIGRFLTNTFGEPPAMFSMDSAFGPPGSPLRRYGQSLVTTNTEGLEATTPNAMTGLNTPATEGQLPSLPVQPTQLPPAQPLRHPGQNYPGGPKPMQGPPMPPAAKPAVPGGAAAQDAPPAAAPASGGHNGQLTGYVQVDPNSGGQGPSLGMTADDVIAQKKLIDSIYPNRTYDDAAQNRADKYAEGEMARTKALAQLALFAGITKGAGGDWEGVGQGFASAGSQYTSGFDRYSKALQSKATRANERSDQKYSDGVARTDAAVKLYAQNQALKEKYADNLRAGYKDKQDDIDKYYKTYIDTLKPEGGMPMSPEDSQRREDAMKEWQDSKAAGYIIRTHNVPKDAK